MKKIFSLIFAFAVFSSPAFTEDQNNQATQQAKEDYRAYLQALKGINTQYKEVTNQIKEVIREEGIPVWNETTGEIEFQKGLVNDPAQSGIKETDTEMTVTVDLPGVRKQDVQVKIEDGRFLKVDAVREGVPVVKLIHLPAPADEKSKPKASLVDGVLNVKIVKAPQVKTQIVVPVQ